ncbi:hypothetical protein NYE48_10900 [Paenibacillus sp. FSL M7-1455]|jgi:hypothetical protein|uniref:Uncharacterized protein n=1 Tax=Paenibacillus cookii TaxID=157839 RepID=A0ABQ4LS43_9BACL|nr:hypothetical protein [Paenibacillus cookii]KHF35235.1 hypothetical protein CM49_02576 [Paenibacillus sp. P1XP2]GIO66074.1 hypothetical protein J21TS3_08950 [Paenibacillus cookii]
MWYKRVEHIERKNLSHEIYNADFAINQLSVNTSAPYHLEENSLLQWIVAPFLQEKRGTSFEVPLYSLEIYRFIIDLVAPHFNSIEGIHENNELTSIRLSEMKNESRMAFQQVVTENDILSPVVKDFYLRSELDIRNQVLDCEDIEIIIDNFQAMNNVENRELETSIWEYLNNIMLLNGGNIILAPQNWLFNENLLESPTLEYFSRYAKRLYLTINKFNMHVRAIEIFIE